MTKIEKVIELLKIISDDISGISTIFNSNKLKENKKQELNNLVNEVSDMLIEVDILLIEADKRDVKNNIEDLNEEFKTLVDAISVMLASYADSKHSITYEKAYEKLLEELADLEESKLILEKKTGIHIYKIKPTLEKGRKLMVESLQVFLKDLKTIKRKYQKF